MGGVGGGLYDFFVPCVFSVKGVSTRDQRLLFLKINTCKLMSEICLHSSSNHASIEESTSIQPNIIMNETTLVFAIQKSVCVHVHIYNCMFFF